MNYYQFHIGDFRSGTVNMSRQVRWIYRDMLDIYYDTESALTLDFESLCDSLGVDSEAEEAAVRKILRFKFEKTNSGYINDTCDRVIAEYHQKAEIAKANGKRGGRPSKANANPTKPIGFPSGSDSEAISTQEETGSQTNHEPLTINQEPFIGESAEAQPIPKKARLPSIDKPGSVTEQTWADWLALRKAKKAPVTLTVVNGAMEEADKAGLTAEQFLKIWCVRGSQGLQADWIKPEERRQFQQAAPLESFSERDERKANERYMEATGQSPAPAKPMGEVIDITPMRITK